MKSNHPVWTVLRWLTLSLCLLFPAWKVVQAFAADHYARFWTLPFMMIFAAVLLALWYLVFGGKPFRKRLLRFGLLAVAAVAATVIFFSLFRYEGSVGGGSFPKFAGRWTPESTELAPALPDISNPTATRRPPSRELEGIVDSAQFYGPGRDAMWPEAQLIASFDWTADPPEELWRKPFGMGWSGFAVAGGLAVTQEQRGDEELVTCYDLPTGDLLWAHADPTGFYAVAEAEGNKMKAMAGEGPRAVPTIHGEKVYSYGATGVLNCLELESGESLWSRNVLDDHGAALAMWGKSCSPLVIGDLGLVVVSVAENAAPTLAAFRMEDGEPDWIYQSNGASYSSPTLIDLYGVRQLVSVNGHDVTGHDPATGEELWCFGWKGSFPKVAQPILLPGNRLLVTASYGVGSHLIQIHQEEGKWSAEPVWRTPRLKTKFSTAAVRDGYAYALDEGALACFDLKDARRVWKEGKYGFGQHLLVGDKLLIQAEEGYLAIVKATPDDFEEIARIDALNSMTWNPPTLAGRYLLVRNDKEAVCFRLAAKP